MIVLHTRTKRDVVDIAPLNDLLRMKCPEQLLCFALGRGIFAENILFSVLRVEDICDILIIIFWRRRIMASDKSGARHIDIQRERGDKFFVLADVHAFYKAMMRALDGQGFDIEDPHHKVILLGDMFDRGDAAKETFAFFNGLGDRLTYVRGNHEDLLYRCLGQFMLGQRPNMAHFLNGTVDTLMQFLGAASFEEFAWIYDAGDTRRMLQLASRLDRAIMPVTELIDAKCVDYATLGDNIFVHGYIPCDHFQATDKYFPISDWRGGDWPASRWSNGPKAWHDGVRAEDGKVVFCGHWRTRDANLLYHGSAGADGEGDNSPFVDDGIVAMDADTANSGICNCIVL